MILVFLPCFSQDKLADLRVFTFFIQDELADSRVFTLLYSGEAC